MGQRLGDGFVGVFELGVLADDGDADLALGIVQAVHHVFPAGQVGLRRGGDAEGVEHRLVEPDAVIGERRLVDRLQVIGGDDGVGADVAEQRDLVAFLFRDRVFGAADEHVGRRPMERSSLTECWVGLVFSSPEAAR